MEEGIDTNDDVPVVSAAACSGPGPGCGCVGSVCKDGDQLMHLRNANV